MILEYPSDILRKRCVEVEVLDETIVQDMLKELKTSGGVGLAAPQIGQLKRIIIVDPYNGTDRSNPTVMVNPSISKSSSKQQEDIEGCLSIPGKKFRVSRSKSVWLSFTNCKGDRIKQFCGGIEARIVQHEIDHLNGITIADRGREVL